MNSYVETGVPARLCGATAPRFLPPRALLTGPRQLFTLHSPARKCRVRVPPYRPTDLSP
jgi:hypothetical protein